MKKKKQEKTSLVKIEQEKAVEIRKGDTFSEMIAYAITQNAPIDQLSKLLDFKERFEKTEAQKSYVVAMNNFKANAPEIVKDKTVSFGDTSYKHATLHNIVKILTPELSKYGLSNKWEVSQTEKEISVTCVITHILGHSERTTISGPADSSGKKNPIQSIGSSTSYLERYSFLAAVGMAAKDQDDDALTVTSEVTDEIVAQFATCKSIDELKEVFNGLYKDAREKVKPELMMRLIDLRNVRISAIRTAEKKGG